MYNSGKSLNEPLMEVAESNEGLDITLPLGYWLLFYSTDLA
jgi:hypothetical protein